ncbi:Proto-oncogene tyrosine-protein kinase ROS [Orchesella cincta]|uniref:Proto-oncogene tyrosine-protein kinase ROS n=1 Tax=Orchesella cincta TaxID=48709 RepID=A0A1D2MSC9_ORCCI|nr:Proto-oncogene tyrosine-protein kinase ROS [Orchesella cincta]
MIMEAKTTFESFTPVKWAAPRQLKNTTFVPQTRGSWDANSVIVFFDLVVYIEGLIGVPDPPTLISDSLKSSSLRLSWEGSALPLPYLVFTVQRRVFSRTSQWETIPSSSQQPLNTTTFTVQTLKPYTEYQFRIGWILANDFPPYYSRESNPIETLPKGLPNPPEITSIQPISNTSVSVTWLPPSQPNGRLIAYILKLRKLPDGHIIIKEIPISQNPRGYTFTGLQPITNYSLEISAQNVEGEGGTAVVNFVTPQSSMSNDISQKPEPKLLLQGIRDVYVQHLDLLLDPDVYVYNSSQNISAIACHYKYKWVFIATSEGDIIRTGLINNQNLLILRKDRLDLPVVSFLAVDWLHNQLYIVGKKRQSSNWSIKRCDLNGNNLITIYPYLFEKPIDFAADPYTGYLYWVSPSSSTQPNRGGGGLFKLDLNSDEFVNGPYPIPVIEGQDLGPFIVDSINYRILIVHKSRNTVLAVSLDGDITDIRRNTQSPQFENALSIAWYSGIFYWTTGQSVVIEEYNADQDSYYQNLYDVAKVHQPCTRLMVVHPDLQPIPIPMAPPQRVQVIYGQTRARVSWRPPPVISGLGTFINLFVPIDEFHLFRPFQLLLLP